MAVSILEALQNADYNLKDPTVPFQLMIAKDQLHNAVTLLEKGYNIHTYVEPLIERWGNVEDVPDIDDNNEINQDD